MKTNMNNIGVVIVTFNPDVKLLTSKLTRLGNNITIAIVDNTQDETISIVQNNVIYIPLHENTGIANAQNEGVRHLLKHSCSHIVFFDQDSDFSEDYVIQMVYEYNRIEAMYTNLFCLGPRVINKSSGEEYRSVIHTENKADNGFIQKREIISSGSCVSVAKLKQVGLMATALFIDYVDFELCWRAEAQGYVCGITVRITLQHKVGYRELHFPKGYNVIISAPFRYFYQYRNYLWLLNKSYVPLTWKTNTGGKLLLRILYFPFIVKGWRLIEKNIFKGIYHGLFKRKL